MDKRENSIPHFIGSRNDLIDKILIFLIGTSMLFYYFRIEIWNVIFMYSMFFGATVYLIMAYYDNKDQDKQPFEKIMYNIQRVGTSLSFLGITFVVLQWKDYKSMLIVGGLSTLIATLFSVYFFMKRPNNKTNNLEVIIKFGLISMVSIWMTFI